MTAEVLEIGARDIAEHEPTTTAVNRPIHVAPPADPTAEQIMRIVEASGALDFWDRDEEDVYSPEDGEPA